MILFSSCKATVLDHCTFPSISITLYVTLRAPWLNLLEAIRRPLCPSALQCLWLCCSSLCNGLIISAILSLFFVCVTIYTEVDQGVAKITICFSLLVSSCTRWEHWPYWPHPSPDPGEGNYVTCEVGRMNWACSTQLLPVLVQRQPGCRQVSLGLLLWEHEEQPIHVDEASDSAVPVPRQKCLSNTGWPLVSAFLWLTSFTQFGTGAGGERVLNCNLAKHSYFGILLAPSSNLAVFSIWANDTSNVTRLEVISCLTWLSYFTLYPLWFQPLPIKLKELSWSVLICSIWELGELYKDKVDPSYSHWVYSLSCFSSNGKGGTLRHSLPSLQLSR